MSDERVSDEQLCQIVQYDFAGTVAKQIAHECQQHRQREREFAAAHAAEGVILAGKDARIKELEQQLASARETNRRWERLERKDTWISICIPIANGVVDVYSNKSGGEGPSVLAVWPDRRVEHASVFDALAAIERYEAEQKKGGAI